jgi:hypothetical protein
VPGGDLFGTARQFTTWQRFQHPAAQLGRSETRRFSLPSHP